MHPAVAELKLAEAQAIAREILHYHVPKSLTALPCRGRFSEQMQTGDVVASLLNPRLISLLTPG
jgi:hypothetical protein